MKLRMWRNNQARAFALACRLRLYMLYILVLYQR
jgi:hypothetical protein